MPLIGNGGRSSYISEVDDMMTLLTRNWFGRGMKLKAVYIFVGVISRIDRVRGRGRRGLAGTVMQPMVT